MSNGTGVGLVEVYRSRNRRAGAFANSGRNTDADSYGDSYRDSDSDLHTRRSIANPNFDATPNVNAVGTVRRELRWSDPSDLAPRLGSGSNPDPGDGSGWVVSNVDRRYTAQ